MHPAQAAGVRRRAIERLHQRLADTQHGKQKHDPGGKSLHG
jgi:hypothetical protein